MMLQMLAAGGLPILSDDNRPPDDDNPRGYYEFRRAAGLRRDRDWVPDAKGKAVKIVAQLLPMLPPSDDLKYRVVFMERDLDEILRSQTVMLSRQGKQGASLPEDSLKDVFASQLRSVRRMLAVRKIPTLYITYHDTVKSPDSVADKLNAFLGKDLDTSAMSAAVDPALYRQRKDK